MHGLQPGRAERVKPSGHPEKNLPAGGSSGGGYPLSSDSIRAVQRARLLGHRLDLARPGAVGPGEAAPEGIDLDFSICDDRT